jgi:citrate synthase
MPETLTITDNRTGRSFDVPIEDGAIRTTALREAKITEDDFGLMSYDPAFLNTASVRSAITFIDGDRGVLRYRGYPIEQLAEQSTYLETAYLLVFGELPTNTELARWADEITHHTFLHENVKSRCRGSATTRTRWACSSASWPHCPRFIPRRRRSTIPSSGCSRSYG